MKGRRVKVLNEVEVEAGVKADSLESINALDLDVFLQRFAMERYV